MKILTIENLSYLSEGDEHAFFKWLNSIKSVQSFSGVGSALEISVSENVPDNDLREFIALFFRYSADLRQLSIFKTRENSSWFIENPNAYWAKELSE